MRAALCRNFVVGAVASLAFAGCRPGDSPAPKVNQAVGGIWRGTFTTPSGGSVMGVALVAENGRLFSFAENLANGCAEVAEGDVSANGDVLSGTATFALITFTTTPGIATDCSYKDGSISGNGHAIGNHRAALYTYINL